MDKNIRLTGLQLRAIKQIVETSIEDEKEFLKEIEFELHGSELESLTDEELYEYCTKGEWKDHCVNYMWVQMYELQKIVENNLVE